MKTKVYIAGKVTGLPFNAVAAKFYGEAILLFINGFEPVNPIAVVNSPVLPWYIAMKLCIAALIQCDAVLLLPCYTDSKGALIEAELARNVGIKVFHNLADLIEWNKSLQPTQ